MRPPSEPSYSCPNLDAAIQEIENARKIHDDLRTWGKWWQGRAEELGEEHGQAIDDKDDEIKELNNKIEQLQDEIKYLQGCVAEAA